MVPQRTRIRWCPRLPLRGYRGTWRSRTETPGFSSRDVMDEAALRLAGFEVEVKVKTCGSCGNKVLRPRKCCDAFSRERRANSKAVRGLELVCMEDSGRDSVDPLGD
jgi:hypothetical protein